jgi:hypothetical protein
MCNPLKGKKEKQLPKKKLNISSNSIFNFFCYKGTFQERWCVAKIIFGKFEAFSYPQSFALIICEECLVKVFKCAFVSKSCFSFFLIFFTKNDIWLSVKN